MQTITVQIGVVEQRRTHTRERSPYLEQVRCRPMECLRRPGGSQGHGGQGRGQRAWLHRSGSFASRLTRVSREDVHRARAWWPAWALPFRAIEPSARKPDRTSRATPSKEGSSWTVGWRRLQTPIRRPGIPRLTRERRTQRTLTRDGATRRYTGSNADEGGGRSGIPEVHG